MNLPAGMLPQLLTGAADLAYALLIALALWKAPWRRLEKSEQMHVFLGSSVLMLLIWSMKAGITPGLDFHLLGGTLFLLMFGWELALIALSVVIGGVTFFSGAGWETFALNVLLMGAVPVFASLLVLRLAVRFLPHHFFVYVMVNAYLCGGLAMALTVTTGSLLLLSFGPYSFDQLARQYLPFAPFMIFAEGFFSGMLAAGMALMRPEWITSFDDRRYLIGK